MPKVIILSGVSGSGKSTYARKHFPEAIRLSADDYFLQDAKWNFDPTKLTEAHAECFSKFLFHLASPASKEEVIVVDNTNCSAWEIAPYVLAATSFGFEHEIITLFVPWNKLEECARRNVHNVPTNVISKMFDVLLKRTLPGHWNAREVDAHRQEIANIHPSNCPCNDCR